MKLTYLPGLLLFVMLVSCSGKEEEAPVKETVTRVEKEIELSQDDLDRLFEPDSLLGTYAGNFGKSEIRVALNYVSESHAVGTNLHRGVQRNIAGNVTPKANAIEFELSEPGDHPFDGTFRFAVDKDGRTMKGNWTPNDPEFKSKSFKLKRVVKSSKYIPFEKVKTSMIDNSNFTHYFSYVSDSTGNIVFENSGLCTFSYYPKYDHETFKDQMITFNGNWSVANGTLTVVWNENNIFKEKKSLMDIHIDGANWEIYLKHPEHTFHSNEMF
ncbi:MAG: hypothetical protein EP338_05985 [Bacteroidetes bacterium]|nr:MAG: hypothetical protein EP338_05985 [Bacteroidota bacterium]